MDISLNRIIIYGADISALKKFYIENFNLTVVEEIPGEWLVLNAGIVEIAFHRIGEQYRSEKPFKANSNVKLVFSLLDDIAVYREKLVANNVEMSEIKSYQGLGYLLCDGIDIEGNIFQLMQTPSTF